MNATIQTQQSYRIQELESRLAESESLGECLKQEAQIHAQEARTANATIAEIYQAISGKSGEPGNWNGSRPVVEYIAAAEARAEEYRRDAERYRWLRSCYTHMQVVIASIENNIATVLIDGRLDAAIDAALAKSSTDKGEG